MIFTSPSLVSSQQVPGIGVGRILGAQLPPERPVQDAFFQQVDLGERLLNQSIYFLILLIKSV